MILMWALIVVGGYILIRIIGPVHLENNEFGSSVLKAAIALSMVLVWIWILVALKNAYVKRNLFSKE